MELAAEAPESDVSVVGARDNLVLAEREASDCAAVSYECRRTATFLASPDLQTEDVSASCDAAVKIGDVP